MRLATLEKAIQVIELLSKNPTGMGLGQMSDVLHFPKSSLHHILSTLAPHGYVTQDPHTKRYSLGLRFLTISKAILDSIDVRRVAGRYLLELQDELTDKDGKCREAIHLAVLREGKVVYIEKIDSHVGLSLATYVGFSTDPHAAAGGKVLLSELSPQEVSNIYRGRELTSYGKNTITNMEDLLRELDKVRRQGYAIDDEEYYEGVRCVAAPIRAGGRIVAALSITGSIFTMTMERIRGELVGRVVEKAGMISSQMNW